MEGPHIRGRNGGVYFTRGKKGIYWISYQNERGRETRCSTGTTDAKKAAKMLDDERRKVINAQVEHTPYEAPSLRRITIGKTLEGFEAHYRLHNKWHDTSASDCKILKARFGGMSCEHLTKEVFQKYQLECKQGLSEKKSISLNSTLNRRLWTLTRAMQIAGVTPFYLKDMKNLRLPEPPARQGFFEPYEFRILLSALPPHIQDVVLCLYLTGWRLSEVIGRVELKKYRPGLLWSEMDGDNLRIPGERHKNRKPKFMPLTGELAELIDRRRRVRVAHSDLVFHKGDGLPVGDFHRLWEMACAAAGKPGAMIHDLRRSRARAWIRAGVAERTAMELGGWRSREIFSRYNVVSEADMRSAQERTEEYLKQQVEKHAKKGSTAVN